ncbi:hypothetical protein NMG60_11002631 [Bertholletia excelsa]
MAKDGLGLDITELRLGLPGMEKNEKKRAFTDMAGAAAGDCKTERKDRVVGWPPVGSYRRKNGIGAGGEEKKMYVKVSMDGALFLRKIDLGTPTGYDDLAKAIEKLFDCFGIVEAMKYGDSSEYVPIYEDKDGDWMLVGDVPWRMFIESCKRLRIMKRSEAKGVEELRVKNLLKGASQDE